MESCIPGFVLDAGLYKSFVTIHRIQYGNPGLHISLIWESWSAGKLILDVVLVQISSLLNLIRFCTKRVESCIPGFGLDSGLYESLIN